jgi:hypothetical protein
MFNYVNNKINLANSFTKLLNKASYKGFIMGLNIKQDYGYREVKGGTKEEDNE